jgi:hypothetical protein
MTRSIRIDLEEIRTRYRDSVAVSKLRVRTVAYSCADNLQELSFVVSRNDNKK